MGSNQQETDQLVPGQLIPMDVIKGQETVMAEQASVCYASESCDACAVMTTGLLKMLIIDGFIAKNKLDDTLDVSHPFSSSEVSS